MCNKNKIVVRTTRNSFNGRTRPNRPRQFVPSLSKTTAKPRKRCKFSKPRATLTTTSTPPTTAFAPIVCADGLFKNVEQYERNLRNAYGNDAVSRVKIFQTKFGLKRTCRPPELITNVFRGENARVYNRVPALFTDDDRGSDVLLTATESITEYCFIVVVLFGEKMPEHRLLSNVSAKLHWCWFTTVCRWRANGIENVVIFGSNKTENRVVSIQRESKSNPNIDVLLFCFRCALRIAEWSIKWRYAFYTQHELVESKLYPCVYVRDNEMKTI